jgi:hypothetical protein
MQVTDTMSSKLQVTLIRVFYAAWILAWLNRLQSHVLLHQMQAPVLFNAHVDPVYWLAHNLRLPEISTQSYPFALTIDLLLVIIPVLTLKYPTKRLLSILFTCCFFVYFLAFNTYGLKHTHCLIGFLLVPLAFWFRDARAQLLLWGALRFFACWIFVAAFLWKLRRGYFLARDHGMSILLDTRADYLAQNDSTLLSKLLFWLIGHPSLMDFITISGGVLQGCFLVGFFTKRFDKYLVTLSFLFHTINYFLFDIVFFELWVLNLSFLAVRDAEK